MFCSNCGNKINNTEFCSKCGNKSSQSAKDQRDPNLIYPKDPPHSRWVAAWSLIIPGVSQFILGQTALGFICIGMVILNVMLPTPDQLGFALGTIISISAFMAALRSINILKTGKPVDKWGNES
jgi:hypothetical protein